MKNYYKKHLNIFIKGKNPLHLQREEDLYYITDGYTILRLNAVEYTMFAQAYNPVFIPLENGQRATKQLTEILPKLNPSGMDIKKFFPEEMNIPVKVTPFEYLDSENKTRISIVQAGNRLVTYNAAYIEAASEYTGRKFSVHKLEKFPVLGYSDDVGTGCAIMPINKPEVADDLEFLFRKL